MTRIILAAVMAAMTWSTAMAEETYDERRYVVMRADMTPLAQGDEEHAKAEFDRLVSGGQRVYLALIVAGTEREERLRKVWYRHAPRVQKAEAAE